MTRYLIQKAAHRPVPDFGCPPAVAYVHIYTTNTVRREEECIKADRIDHIYRGCGDFWIVGSQLCYILENMRVALGASYAILASDYEIWSSRIRPGIWGEIHTAICRFLLSSSYLTLLRSNVRWLGIWVTCEDRQYQCLQHVLAVTYSGHIDLAMGCGHSSGLFAQFAPSI